MGQSPLTLQGNSLIPINGLIKTLDIRMIPQIISILYANKNISFDLPAINILNLGIDILNNAPTLSSKLNTISSKYDFTQDYISLYYNSGLLLKNITNPPVQTVKKGATCIVIYVDNILLTSDTTTKTVNLQILLKPNTVTDINRINQTSFINNIYSYFTTNIIKYSNIVDIESINKSQPFSDSTIKVTNIPDRKYENVLYLHETNTRTPTNTINLNISQETVIILCNPICSTLNIIITPYLTPVAKPCPAPPACPDCKPPKTSLGLIPNILELPNDTSFYMLLFVIFIALLIGSLAGYIFNS